MEEGHAGSELRPQKRPSKRRGRLKMKEGEAYI